MRRLFPAAIFTLGLVLAWWFWPRDVDSTPGRIPRPPRAAPAGKTLATSAAQPSAGVSADASARATWSADDFPIVAPLNRADSTIAKDLETLQHLFDAWRSNFPREGNPVGENADITAALVGDNRLGLALVPKAHPAINAQGELCDRWGTPYRFHQLSGQQMEIRSAGPDRKFATGDDALWTPP